MSVIIDHMPLSISTNVKITDKTKNVVLVDDSNAIHPANMSRVISRALAGEPNAVFSRLAFGNGGTTRDASDNVIFKLPNDGTRGDGWESRLYNETYSEGIDEDSVNFKIDVGSADSSNVRIGGGSSPNDDPSGGGVVSQEVGTKSNIVITCFLNTNEPNGQLNESTTEPDSTDFVFDELAIYSPGRQAVSTSGYSTVDVDNKTSTDNSLLVPNSVLYLTLTVDSTIYNVELTVPASGTGTSGEITYGDICEGINTGSWITGGDNINDYVYVYITDYSGATYPTIVEKQSYGMLTFQSKTVGASSSVSIDCDSGTSDDFMNVLTGGVCGNVNFVSDTGDSAGVANDPSNPNNERERLLTHLIFNPIHKARDTEIEIVYTLTVSVGYTESSPTNITQS